jgi:hypothetical protein
MLQTSDVQLETMFGTPRPVIGVIHLLALPGAPGFGGNVSAVYDHALAELSRLTVEGGKDGSVDGVIVENFHDIPFYPDRVPAETTAAMAAITREIVTRSRIPVGVNVLRNDARAALGVATVTEAAFIRVNVHMGVAVAEQGFLVGESHHTLRLRAALGSAVAIFADVAVKHAAPLAGRGLSSEAVDAAYRGMADALIVSGDRTGGGASTADLTQVTESTDLPVLVGSGVTDATAAGLLEHADGLIVGTHLKLDGAVDAPVDPERVVRLMSAVRGR